jgi:HSP20 family protein
MDGMSMMRYRPGMGDLADWMSRWMDFPGQMLQQWMAGMPMVDVREDAEHVHVRAEIPGIDPGKLEVRIDDRTLTLQGEYHEDEKDEDETWVAHRRGSFHRTILLPADVDADRATASCRNGVLRIDIPKRSGGRGRRIPVRADGAH